MKLLGDSLAHAMHLATAARTRLLIVGKIILDALARQVRRQRPAAALLSRCVFDGWQARVRKFGDIVRFTAGVILIGGLLGFIEETIDVLFAAWRKTMQVCQRQLFLEFDDPFGELGYLQAQQFRACRLVADTGLHAKGWTEDQAVDYLRTTGRRSEETARAETHRYIVGPGQATAYKIGMIRILALRAEAAKALGPKFDIKAFNDMIIASGSLPLSVLDMRVREWIAERKAG